MNNWLFLIVVGILLAATIVGYCRGFIKLAVTILSLVVTIFIVQMATPHVSKFLREATPLYTTIQEMVDETVGMADMPMEEIPLNDQIDLIDGFSLPALLKGALIENNNSEVYKVLGVLRFKEYISSYISNTIVNAISFLLAFIFIYTIFKIIIFALDIVSRLPVINGINRIAGGVLGLLQGLIIIWLLSLTVTAFTGTTWGDIIFRQIEANKFLTFLYENNIFTKFAMSVLTIFL